MAFQTGAMLYTQGFASRPENVEVPHIDVRAPTSADVNFYPVGKRWIYQGVAEYVLISFSSSQGATSANWALVTSLAGDVNTLTGDSGTATPSSGNIQIAGTANQISTVGSGSTVTLSLVGPYTPATYTAHGVLIGEGTGNIVATTPGTNGQLLIGGTGDPAFATATTITGLTFTGGNNTLQIDVKQGGYALNNVTGTSSALAIQNMYIANNAALVTLTLPSTAAQGTFIKVVGNGAGGWSIAQNANQIIHLNGSPTTTGVNGSLSSSNRYNSVELVCTVANLEWVVASYSGTLTVV